MTTRPSLLNVQRWLYVMQFSEYTASAFYSGLVDTLAPAVRWQAAVDTLYRFALCGLIRSEPAADEPEGTISYVKRIASINPHPPGKLSVEWIEVDLCVTEKCSDLIRKYVTAEKLWAPSIDLDKELLALFESNRVPFDVYPVLKVATD